MDFVGEICQRNIGTALQGGNRCSAKFLLTHAKYFHCFRDFRLRAQAPRRAALRSYLRYRGHVPDRATGEDDGISPGTAHRPCASSRRDLKASKRFYQAVLGALGHQPTYETTVLCVRRVLRRRGERITAPRPTSHSRPRAPMRCSGSTMPDWPMAAPTMDRRRAKLPSGLYAAFLLDPDGNNVEAAITDRTRARPRCGRPSA